MTKASSRATSARAARSSSRPRRCGCWRDEARVFSSLVALDLLGLADRPLRHARAEGVLARALAPALGLHLADLGGTPVPVPGAAQRARLLASAASTRGGSGAAGSGRSSQLAHRRRASRARLPARHAQDRDTYTAFPAGVLICGGLIGLFRASYESMTRDVFRKSACGAASSSSAKASRCAACGRQLGRGRGGIDYAFVGVGRVVGSRVGASAPRLARALAAILSADPVDELIVTDDFKERELSRSSSTRTAAACACASRRRRPNSSSRAASTRPSRACRSSSCARPS